MGLFSHINGFITVVIVLVGPPLISCQQASPCTHKNIWEAEWLADPQDCRGYYICHLKISHHRYCDAPNTVWQPAYKVCCIKGSYMDVCSTGVSTVGSPVAGNGGSITASACEPGMTSMLLHPKNCARYYDCNQSNRLPQLDVPYERECSYPNLFNAVTGACEHFSRVNCGNRYIPKNPCDYALNQCTMASCTPCNLRFPSCDGLPDGRNQWREKPNTAYYVTCRNQRVESQGQCPLVGGVQYIFHAFYRMCVETPF